jgi:hypothetical protein
MLFWIFLFPFALPSIPIAVYTDWSVWCGFIGLGFFVGSLIFAVHMNRNSNGTSGYLGLVAATVLPTGSFMLSNFLAALVKYLMIHLVWV